MTDAADPVEPVECARTGRQHIRLDAVEAAFLSLCKRASKGHKTELLEAIRIMMESDTRSSGGGTGPEGMREAVREIAET